MALPERGTLSSLLTYEGGGISLIEVYPWKGSEISVSFRQQSPKGLADVFYDCKKKSRKRFDFVINSYIKGIGNAFKAVKGDVKF